MSIVYYKEITGRDGGVDEESREWTRLWRLKTSDRMQGAALIANELATDPAFPKVGDEHPIDSEAKVRRIRVTDISPIHWIVSVFYSDKEDISDNPTEDATVITWDGDEVQRPFVEDIDGNAVVNSVGEPFEGLEYDDTRLTTTIVSNVTEVPADILDFRNVINETDIVVDGILFPEQTARIKKIPVSEKKKRNGITYRTITVKLFIDERGWARRILDVGFSQFTPGDPSKRSSIQRDGDGSDVQTPVMLDGNGGVLANPTTSNAVYLTYDQYEARDFTTLPGIEPVL